MAESLKHVILRLAEERAGATFSPTEAAMALRPPRPDEVKGEEKWRGFLRQVRAEAKGLARQGRIDILRRGEPQDPSKPIKGLIQLRKTPECAMILARRLPPLRAEP